jgi:hypothetical protein
MNILTDLLRVALPLTVVGVYVEIWRTRKEHS